MTALHVEQPGLLSLLQDAGRFGQAALGLTTGGPMDPLAFQLANRLLGNAAGCPAIEVSFGGLVLEADCDTQLSVTGAALPLDVNGEERLLWEVLELRAGDRLTLGYSERGCRSYVAVVGGFDVASSFGSVATVPREGIGGLHGGPLRQGDLLPINSVPPVPRMRLPTVMRPSYANETTLRVIPGYQQQHFSRIDQRRFFSSEYRVSERCDRMGYRLEGPAIHADIDGILSEGIAHGAIQLPADGQPIVLLSDRQTIGGYPKLGCVLASDCAALGQLRPGATVHFTPISANEAHNALHLAHRYVQSLHLEPVSA